MKFSLATVSILMACAAWASPARASSKVWVIDDMPGPGVDFTSVQSAIDTAAEGDILLFKAGNYSPGQPVVLNAKSLSLVADLNATVVLDRPLTIQNLATEQAVVLRGIDVSSSQPGPALRSSSNKGSVWIEDCLVQSLPPSVGDALRIERSDSVSVARCVLQGSSPPIGTGGNGLFAMLSSISVDACSLSGGSGAPGSPTDSAGNGGDGAVLAGGLSRLSNCTFYGGQGGNGYFDAIPNCGSGADGGHALHLLSSQPLADVLTCSLQAGAAGAALAPCAPGSAGQTSKIDSGNLLTGQGAVHGMLAVTPVREGQTLSMSFAGVAADLVLLAISGVPGFVHAPGLGGVLLLGAPLQLFPVGSLPAANLLHLSIGELGLGVQGVMVRVQAAFVSNSGNVSLSGPTAVLLLDQAI